eukprot:2407702-Amphidinium_carterae.5
MECGRAPGQFKVLTGAGPCEVWLLSCGCRGCGNDLVGRTPNQRRESVTKDGILINCCRARPRTAISAYPCAASHHHRREECKRWADVHSQCVCSRLPALSVDKGAGRLEEVKGGKHVKGVDGRPDPSDTYNEFRILAGSGTRKWNDEQ